MSEPGMSALDSLAPAQHRARYLALREAAAARAARPGQPAPAPDRSRPERTVLLRETIPAGWYWTVRLEQGAGLRIINRSGRAAAALQIWNATDPVERFNSGDTVKLQWSALLIGARLLFSDMGRVLASVTDDGAAGRHDMISGASTPQSNLARYGGADLRNTRDNFRLAAAKHGLSRRDVHPGLTLFAGVRTDADGRFVWQDGARAGEHVDLRAEMPILVALSNCPHPLDPAPAYDPGEIEAIVFAGQPVAPHDPCRSSGEEAQRGFENTDAWLASTGIASPAGASATARDGSAAR